jgi:hypothetical protein
VVTWCDLSPIEDSIMSRYIKEQSVGELFRNAVTIYFAHWGSVVIPFVLLILPLNVVQFAATLDGNTALTWLAAVANLPLAFLAYGAIVISVSEACLGAKPNGIRALKKVLTTMFWRLAVTGLLQTLVLFVGLVLLVIPGLLAMVWFVFAQVAVVLDESWSIGALKRSKELATGYHWRTAGVMMLLGILFVVLAAFLIAFLGALGADPETNLLLVVALELFFLYPILTVILVLIYYDLRVRKEGFNMAALEQDLAR